MKRLLSSVLALVLVISLCPSAFAAGIQELGKLYASAGPDEVQLMYYDPAYLIVNDTKRIFTSADNQTKECGSARLQGGKLNEIPTAPQVKGWTFEGWYTAPVKYAFWGDTPKTPYTKTEDIPSGFEKDCDGVAYNFTSEKDPKNPLGPTLTSYWRWLSSLEDDGGKLVANETNLTAGQKLYALYKPQKIEYTLDYNGWNKLTGTMTCTREYGTPIGAQMETNWDGFVFDGWFDNDEQVTFYKTPQEGARYTAHWHSSDNRVNQSNYKQVGYIPITGLSLCDGDVGKGNKDLGDILQISDGNGSKKITVSLSPSECGVTDLEWIIEDPTIAEINFNNTDKLSATITCRGVQGTTKLTVRTKDQKVSDSVIIDTTGHSFDKSQVIKWGNCANPTQILYTCVACGVTQLKESYANHTWAWRDIPGTCTTDHVWEHYCKVCGATDPNESTRYKLQSEAKGHQFKTTTTSGCGGTETTKICTVCGFTETTSDSSAATHSWDSVATVDVRPTCHSEGSQSIKCLKCGAIKSGSSDVIPRDPSLHTWGKWDVDKEATATEAGNQKRTCSTCGAVEERAIPPTDLSDNAYKIADDVKEHTIPDQVVDHNDVATILHDTLKALLSDNSSMLADDILFAFYQDQKLSTEIAITPVTAPDEAEAKEFNKYFSSDVTAAYLDIDILVKAGGQNLGRLTETDGDISFSFKLPGEGRYITVLRAHDGKVDKIANKVDGDTVTFATNKFSTYAVVVSNTELVPDEGSTSGGSSGGGGSSSSSSGSSTPADTTLKPDITAGTDGSASTTINSQAVTNGIKEAQSKKQDSVVVAPNVKGDADKVAVTIPKISVGDIGKADLSLTVQTGIGNVNLPAASLKALAKQDGSTLKVTIEATDDSSTRIEVKVGDKVVDSLKGGMSVEIPAAKGNVLVIVDAKGNETVVRKSVITDKMARALLDGSCTVKTVDNSKKFADVGTSWYTDAVNFASSHELFKGATDTSFDPEGHMTRAMLTTVLWRLENEATPVASAVFKDAGAGSWFSEGIAWASEAGIVQGYGDGTFGPDDSITREQLATMLYRYAKHAGMNTKSSKGLSGFADQNSVSGYALEAMQWAVATGLVQGKNNGLLDPAGNATRAEVAQIAQRLITLMVQ